MIWNSFKIKLNKMNKIENFDNKIDCLLWWLNIQKIKVIITYNRNDLKFVESQMKKILRIVQNFLKKNFFRQDWSGTYNIL